MGSQLLAESLGRDPRFEISGVVAAAEILSLAGSIKADVAVISLDSDSATKKGLQVARTLSSASPRASYCGFAGSECAGLGDCGFSLWRNRRVLPNRAII